MVSAIQFVLLHSVIPNSSSHLGYNFRRLKTILVVTYKYEILDMDIIPHLLLHKNAYLEQLFSFDQYILYITFLSSSRSSS